MNATMSLEKTKHYPVMLDQVLSIISPQHGGTIIDCTFGAGGYSEAILKFPKTKVIAIDRDDLAKKKAEILLKKFPNRFSFYKEKFSNLNEVANRNIKPKAIIFDLGVSSFQISDEKRGFSFNSKNFLNMEMGINSYSAFEVINSFDKEILSTIIKILGEEKDGKKIANKIDKYRKINPISNSYDLATIVNEAKKNFKKNNKNPATKTFQAIRIFINQELSELINGLIKATEILPNDGILIIVSFHSLEDRIVKNFFNTYSNLKKNPSRYIPINEKKNSLFSSVLKKPLLPTNKEIGENNRSRSAKLRYGIRNNNSSYNFKDFIKRYKNYLNLEGSKI